MDLQPYILQIHENRKIASLKNRFKNIKSTNGNDKIS